MKSKKPLIAAGVVSLGLAGLAGLSTVSAQHASGSDSLIDKLTAKFNLDKEEVKAVFDEVKTEQDAKRQAEQSERLQELVDDGDITEAQNTLIEQKMSELQAARETERKELEAWAESQGIDAGYLMKGDPRGDDDRLQDAVDDGDITEAQKTAIETKQEELETKREEAHDALEQWAGDNDIDLDLLHGFGGGRHGGPGGPGRI